MNSRLHTVFFLLLSVLFFSTAPRAYAEDREGGTVLSTRIAKAHEAGIMFQEASLFAPATGTAHPALLSKETILQPLGEQIGDLFTAHPQAVSVTFRHSDGATYKLEMLRSQPTSDQPNMGYIDATGRHKITCDPGLHYQGCVVGAERSIAAMSVFANGDVMILFANSEGNFVVGKLEDGSGKYILYNDNDMRSRPYSPCGVSDAAYIGNDGQGKTQKTTTALGCQKVRLYWEVAYNLYTNKGSSLVNTQNYIIGLFNQFQVMYFNERIAMELKSMYVWTVQDDYPTSGSGAALDRFKGYWNALGNGFDGDIAHIIARDNKGNGGLAYLDVLCNKNYAYGYSDIDGSYNAVPTFSWDVEVITHETGHNLGSHHTHWCGWMTGAGGTCGSIDNCYTQETTSTCSSCGATSLNSAATTAWKGTVMSYCHLVARGISLANGFGPLPGAQVRTRVAASSCLSNILNATLTPTPICANNGAVSLVFPANNFGAAPYVYKWSNNASTQNLASLTTSGTYTVQVKDSNGCSASFSTSVIRNPSPGNAITPSQKMPICCNATGIPLSLKAGLPQDLAACQSVYWLRSPAALSSYATAKAYFDTTAKTNILASKNSSSIDNSTAATLDVLPPTSCATSQTYYYTPIVVQVPHTADSFTASSATNTQYKYLGTQIGGYVTLADQSTLPTNCDLLDTPTRQTLTVSVTGYTGRANNMSLVVLDASNIVLYESFGLLGNGTYTIPASSISGSLLQAMKIMAFDFNCTTTACVGSQASVSASRKVVYGTRPAIAASACASGTSVKVTFAQTGCTKLDVSNTGLLNANSVSLYPNPASQSVTIAYSTIASGAVQLKITDMLGKTLLENNIAATAGQHHQVIDVRSWAKGIYFVTVADGHESGQRFKLVVE